MTPGFIELIDKQDNFPTLFKIEDISYLSKDEKTGETLIVWEDGMYSYVKESYEEVKVKLAQECLIVI